MNGMTENLFIIGTPHTPQFNRQCQCPYINVPSSILILYFSLGLNFFAYYFLKLHLRHFSKIKVTKEITTLYGRNQGFSYYFCLMVEGSGSVSVPRTNRSGSGRQKKYPHRSGSATLLLFHINRGCVPLWIQDRLHPAVPDLQRVA